MLTNLDKFYEKPIKMSPFGLSDHATIVVKPKKRGQDNLDRRSTHWAIESTGMKLIFRISEDDSEI